MANSSTPNFDWILPEVGADTNAWGTHLNSNWSALDTMLKTVQTTAEDALPLAGGTMTGAVELAPGSVSAPSLSFAGGSSNGFYWIGTNNFGLACNGAAVMTVSPGAITLPGTLTVTGATTLNGATTANAKLTTMQSGTGGAGLNLPPGAAPTSPTDGDIWRTSEGLFAQIGSTTFGPLNVSLSVAQTFTAAQTFDAPTTLAGGGNLTSAASPATNAIGYLGTPQNFQSGGYTLQMSDAGGSVMMRGVGSTLLIPDNSMIPFPVGTVIVIDAWVTGSITVAMAGSDILGWIPSGAQGSRTLTGPTTATIRKVQTNNWWIYGLNIS